MMYSKNYVCITGASSGIGLETAKAFASLENNPYSSRQTSGAIRETQRGASSQFPKAGYCCQISRPFYFRECL